MQNQFTTDRIGSNVLIFERIRDEAKKASEEPALAGQNAFNAGQQDEIEL